MERTISIMTGKGSLNHNDRKFYAENVDRNRTPDNVVYCNENIRTVYHKLFDEAVKNYNAKQTRSDRVIKNYYKKISTESKQEKPFTEIIIQIGDKDDTGVGTENGLLAKKILDEYMKAFRDRNPYLYVFSAHLHLDEATPHLHIDFVPFTTGSKRGLETRVSLKGALEQQGFVGAGRSNTELNQWRESEKEVLANIMLEHGIKWKQKGTHEKHRSVSAFKRDKLAEEIENLQGQKTDIIHKMSVYKGAEKYAMATAQKLTNNADLEITEPTPLMTAKSYKAKVVEPFVSKLIGIIKDLARRCYRAEKFAAQATEEISKLQAEKEHHKSRAWDLNMENSKLKVKVEEYDKVKSFLGIDKVKEILKAISKPKKRNRDMER